MNKLKTIILATVCSTTIGSAAVAADLPVYDRSTWSHWVDLDKDCEESREEALVRDALFVAYTNGKCTPVYGVWKDPYTDSYFFVARKLDADHIVPLKWAHEHGAVNWTKAEKKAFANDPQNIIMVSASANRSKGAKGPIEYLPPNESYHCEYVDEFDAIVKKYNLTYSVKEEGYNILKKVECENN